MGAIEYTSLIGCRKVLVISGISYLLEMTVKFVGDAEYPNFLLCISRMEYFECTIGRRRS